MVSEASILQSVHFEMSTSWSEKPFQLQCYPWSQRPLFSRVFILKCSAHGLKLSPKCTDPQNPTWAQPWSKAAPTLGVKPQARLGEHAEVSRHRGSSLTNRSPETRKVTKSRAERSGPGALLEGPPVPLGASGSSLGNRMMRAGPTMYDFPEVKQWCVQLFVMVSGRCPGLL